MPYLGSISINYAHKTIGIITLLQNDELIAALQAELL